MAVTLPVTKVVSAGIASEMKTLVSLTLVLVLATWRVKVMRSPAAGVRTLTALVRVTLVWTTLAVSKGENTLPPRRAWAWPSLVSWRGVPPGAVGITTL